MTVIFLKKVFLRTSKIKFIVLGFLVFLLLILPYIKYEIRKVQQYACKNNLQVIGKSLRSLSDDSGVVVDYSNWCDMVIEDSKIDKKFFVCPSMRSNSCQSTYAMNVNISNISDIPNDIVVLFDSKSGWNLIGDEQLLAPENHNGKGCNVLFGDFTVRFIPLKALEYLR